MFFRSKSVNNKKSYIKYPHDAAVASTVVRLNVTAFPPKTPPRVNRFKNPPNAPPPPLVSKRLPTSNFPFFFIADGNRSKLPLTTWPASKPLKIWFGACTTCARRCFASFDHFFSPKIYFGKTEALIRCKSSCVRNERNAREKKYLKIVSSVYSCVSTYDFKQFIIISHIMTTKCSFVYYRAKRKESSYSARVQTTRTQERGKNFRRERQKRGKKYSKKEKKSSLMCLGFVCYPNYWRKAKTISSSEERGSERLHSSLCISLGLLLTTRTRKTG